MDLRIEFDVTFRKANLAGVLGVSSMEFAEICCPLDVTLQCIKPFRTNSSRNAVLPIG